MADVAGSLRDLVSIDGYARRDSPISRLHPTAKLLVAAVFAVFVVSYGRSDISAMLPLLAYPVVTAALCGLPVSKLLLRLLAAEPFLVCVCALSPILDRAPETVLGFRTTRGWATFISIILKGSMLVFSALLLFATTGMERIALALRTLRAPKAFATQLLLTYRYMFILTAEASAAVRAHRLRAPDRKRASLAVWGSLAGHLLLRALARAERVYAAMRVRGFDGEFSYARGGIRRGGGRSASLGARDGMRASVLYTAGWTLCFAAARVWDIPQAIARLLP